MFCIKFFMRNKWAMGRKFYWKLNSKRAIDRYSILNAFRSMDRKEENDIWKEKQITIGYDQWIEWKKIAFDRICQNVQWVES